jgi:hypothetical protein
MIDGGLRKLFRDNLGMLHWQSVETGGTSRGVPDVNFAGDGVEGWIEFKKAEGWKVGLRPEQVAWLTRREGVGGRTFIAVRKKTEKMDTLYIFDGDFARTLVRYGLKSTAALGIWDGGPGKWDWAQIRNVLTET